MSFLSQISVEAMKSPVDEIALQGIEFWSNICDEEMDLTIEMQEVRHLTLLCPSLIYLPGCYPVTYSTLMSAA